MGLKLKNFHLTAMASLMAHAAITKGEFHALEALEACDVIELRQVDPRSFATME